MKKPMFFIAVALSLHHTLPAQVLNQFTISPANPTENETIMVITDFSYYGNCDYGLVDSYTDVYDSAIHIIAIYCGYGDLTLCNSVDTFLVAPTPAGDYPIYMEFHQGSICPISNFDETLYLLDTTVTIADGTSTIHRVSDFSWNVYPNPASDFLLVETSSSHFTGDAFMQVSDVAGRRVFDGIIRQGRSSVDLSEWGSAGVYFIRISDAEGRMQAVRKVIVH